MKRLISVILCIFLLTACASDIDSNKASESEASISTEVPTPTATAAPTPEPTATPIPITWERVESKDQFGDPTGEFFLCGDFSGTYSNKYHTDAPLTVSVAAYPRTKKDGSKEIFYFGCIINEDGLSGFGPTLLDSTIVTFSFKVDGQVYYGKMDKYNGALMFGHDGRETKEEQAVSTVFKKALKDEKEIACSIVVETYSTVSSYTFRVDGYGFWDLLNQK